jgi:hypothetical protein
MYHQNGDNKNPRKYPHHIIPLSFGGYRSIRLEISANNTPAGFL